MNSRVSSEYVATVWQLEIKKLKLIENVLNKLLKRVHAGLRVPGLEGVLPEKEVGWRRHGPMAAVARDRYSWLKNVCGYVGCLGVSGPAFSVLPVGALKGCMSTWSPASAASGRFTGRAPAALLLSRRG